MKNVYKQKRQQGFTIIEVLIVLAIAALILLIVFLAVPALQRNSRNNGIRSDSANILASVNDFVSNHQGKLPDTVACVNGDVTISLNVDAVTSATMVRGGTACNGTGTMPGALGTVSIGFNMKCNATGTGAVPANRAIAALFLVENGSATNPPQCIES